MQNIFSCGMLYFFLVSVFLAPLINAQDNRPVKFSASLTSLYTDNRDSLEKGEENMDISIQPAVKVDMDKGDSSLYFTYAPSYRMRTDPAPDQNDAQLFQELVFDGTYGLGPRTSLRLMDNFYITDDPAVQEYGTTIRRDSSFLLNRAMIVANVPLSRRMSADLSFSHLMKRYDDKIVAKDSDEDGMGAMGGLWFSLSKELGIKVIAKYDAYDYDNSYGLKRGVDTVVGAAGMEYIISEQIRSFLRVGAIRASYEDETLGDQSGPYVDASLIVSPQPATRFSIGAGHSIRNSDVFPFASQKETRGNEGMDWRIDRIKLDMSGQYRIGSYDIDTIPRNFPGTIKQGDEKRVILSAGITFNLGDYTSLRIGQSYQTVSYTHLTLPTIYSV